MPLKIGMLPIRRVIKNAAIRKQTPTTVITRMEVKSWFQSVAVAGMTKSWLAKTTLTNNRPSPAIPATPNPGITNNSAAIKTIPATNNVTSSQPAVPPKKWLQKKISAHKPAIKPPIPKPGALSSTHNPINPNKMIRPVTKGLFRTAIK